MRASRTEVVCVLFSKHSANTDTARSGVKNTDWTSLTCVGHGEAAGRVHHVHLWYKFGNILVLGQSETKDLVLMGASGEKASCWTQKHTFE